MKIPQHIAIIMDGNRRWAKERGLMSFRGHKEGLKTLENISRYCQKRAVRILTVFAFSTENWNRSKEEIDYLMKLFLTIFAKTKIKELIKRGVRVNVMGQKQKFPKTLQVKIKEVEKLTRNNKNFILNIALSYGGRADITEAVRKILRRKISPKAISEGLIAKNLWTKNLPDPDLIIRTGKEQRISNFLLWQGAYSELHFSQKYWPEFTEEDLDIAITEHNRRQRRFGS